MNANAPTHSRDEWTSLAAVFGRDLSPHTIDEYTGLKTTWIEHRP